MLLIAIWLPEVGELVENFASSGGDPGTIVPEVPLSRTVRTINASSSLHFQSDSVLLASAILGSCSAPTLALFVRFVFQNWRFEISREVSNCVLGVSNCRGMLKLVALAFQSCPLTSIEDSALSLVQDL